MHLSASRKQSRLPKRFPVGTTYVVEGRGGEDGHLRVSSRYVVLPGGERINLGADFTGPSSQRIRSRARDRSESQIQNSQSQKNLAPNGGKRRSARAKKIMAAGGTLRQHRR